MAELHFIWILGFRSLCLGSIHWRKNRTPSITLAPLGGGGGWGVGAVQDNGQEHRSQMVTRDTLGLSTTQGYFEKMPGKSLVRAPGKSRSRNTSYYHEYSNLFGLGPGTSLSGSDFHAKENLKTPSTTCGWHCRSTQAESRPASWR